MRLCIILVFAITIEAKRQGADREPAKPKTNNLETNIPIPFGRLDIYGFGDPRFGLKQPVNILDYDPSEPRTPYGTQFKELIKGDAAVSEPRDDKTEDIVKQEGRNETKSLMVYDYAYTLEQNLARRSKTQQKPKSEFLDDEERKIHKFEEGTFIAPEETKIDPLNRTTCEEFAKKAYFHPKEIVNMEWIPFYIWYSVNIGTGLLHTFQFPKREDVRHFKDDIGIYVNRTIDWTAPKLLMSEYRNHLLIAADKRGLFIDIPDHSIPEYVKRTKAPVPSLVLRLKIVDKYLALLYCDMDYAFIMAVPESVPETDEMKIEEAAKLKLKGVGHPVSRDLEYERVLEESRAMRLRAKAKMRQVQEPPIPPIP